MEVTRSVHANQMSQSLVLSHILNITVFINTSQSTVASISSTMSSKTTTSTMAIGASSIASTPFKYGSGKMAKAAAEKSDQRNSYNKEHGIQSAKRKGRDPAILEMVNKQFAKVIDPVAIAIGIVGNALLALVFLITPLRLRPLSHLMAGMGVVDLLYTLSYMLVYLTSKGVQIYQVPGVCQITTFTLTFSKSLQAWCFFMSHLDRLGAHTNSGYERRRRRVFNTKFALIIVPMLVAAPLLHILWSMETRTFAGSSYCVPMGEMMYIHTTLRKIEIIGFVVLPLTLTVGVNLMLLLKAVVYMAYKEDDDDEMAIGFANDANPSSMYTDKIIQLPLQEHPTQRDDHSEVYGCAKFGMATIDELASSTSKSDCHQIQVTSLHYHQTHSEGDLCQSSEDKEMNPLSKIEKKSSIDSTPVSTDSLNSPSRSSSSVLATEKTSEKSDLGVSSESLKTATADTIGLLNCTRNQEENDTTELRREGKTNLSDSQTDEDKTVSKEDKSIFKAASKDKCEGEKRYSTVGFVFSSLKISNWKKPKTMQVSFHEHSYQSGGQPSRYSSVNNISQATSVGVSQWHSYNLTSYASNTSQSRVIPEDHSFPDDKVSCTITTVVMGLIFAFSILPSTFVQAQKLFIDLQSSRPSPFSIQQAILFENFVKLNAVYKFILCALLMPSFRYALMWLSTHWIPSKVTRMSSIFFCRLGAEKNNIVQV